MYIISHRGSNISNYKPNTKQALLTALALPYIDGIELDVRMTKDKKIVIIHDPIINLVSNGSGIVKKMKYKKLSKYNFGTKENPSKISTLEDLLQDIQSDKKIIIEIKEESENYQMIVDKTIQIITKYPLNIYITSFNVNLLRYVHTKFKNCGLLIGFGLNHTRLYNHFAFNIVSYPYKDRVSHLKETFLWTMNEKREGLESFSIITDKPSLFKN